MLISSFFSACGHHRDLHSFPTRRSSDLAAERLALEILRRLDRAVGLHRHRERRLVERSEEHTSELQSRFELVCRLLPEKKNWNRWRTGRWNLRCGVVAAMSDGSLTYRAS